MNTPFFSQQYSPLNVNTVSASPSPIISSEDDGSDLFSQILSQFYPENTDPRLPTMFSSLIPEFNWQPDRDSLKTQLGPQFPEIRLKDNALSSPAGMEKMNAIIEDLFSLASDLVAFLGADYHNATTLRKLKFKRDQLFQKMNHVHAPHHTVVALHQFHIQTQSIRQYDASSPKPDVSPNEQSESPTSLLESTINQLPHLQHAFTQTESMFKFLSHDLDTVNAANFQTIKAEFLSVFVSFSDLSDVPLEKT